MATAVRLDAPARINPPTTAEELLEWPDEDPGEIVDGVFDPTYPDGVATGAGGPHGAVTLEIGRLLGNHVKRHRLGRIFAAETATRLRRNPDLVRCPDGMFVSYARLPGRIPPGVLEGPPDLAVEVLSPTNRPAKVARKVADYLAHGVALVWEVDPEARTVVVHRPGAPPHVRRGSDVLDGGDVLPGLRVLTAELFADLDPDPAPEAR